MPHFLIKKEEIKEDFIELNTSNIDFFHIVKVLRVKPFEDIKFIDNEGFIYYSKIIEVNKNSLKAKIISKEKSFRSLKTNISLIQAVLMSDSQNLLIANAAQTGVKEIYPVISDNISPKIQTLKQKNEKWTKIAFENFKQCERSDLVKIHEIKPLIEALNDFKKENVIIFVEKDDNINLDRAVKSLNLNERIAVVIGPEGGFSEDEFNYFKENGFKMLSLGKMIYKAPNAVVAGISNVITRIEND